MTGQVKSYKDLLVWQKALDLVDAVYLVTRDFPKDEIYGLTNQLRRAAVSVPSNIAEGHARQSSAEFRNFLSIAQGSLAETETQLIIAHRRAYISTQDLQRILLLHNEVSKMLSGLYTKIAQRIEAKK